ncbi:MAG TPA: RNA polymerase factor sigma-54 [Candidatus Hydrogenedens sp.]|nr:RNA polymerase factor sigma-54 [Candidatus Hydrogenedens sp.]
MKLEARQFLQQRQELQLSLFQQQSLQILQMPSIELEQYIIQEAENNPYLEIEFKDNEKEPIPAFGDPDLSSTDTIAHEDISSNDIIQHENTEIDSVEQSEDITEDNEETFELLEEYYDRTKNLKDLSLNTDESEWLEEQFENIRSRETLKNHLIKQLQIEINDPQEVQIGESIIASIDSRGYFVGNMEEISKEFGVEIETVEKVLKKIQRFDPSGVGARNAKECLLIQIEQQYPDNTLLKRLIEEYFDELTHRQIPKIARGLKIEPCKVEELINLLKTLNLFPGHLFPDEPNNIRPDVIVKFNEDDELEIEIYDKYLPEIKYIEPIKKEQIKTLPKEEKEQIKKYKESAIRLIKCLELRNSTLYKVAKEIAILQEEFMRKGVEYLKPLTYKTIADRINIHESTISRCIAGKYMSTPQGIFEFRYFFSGGIKTNEGENEKSSRTVQSIIKRIIDEEDKTKPLSDQQIAELIQQKEGIKIARRTISKYREEMKIPNAFERKVYTK